MARILFEARSKTVKRATDLKESAEMHRQIYRAIRARDPEAARMAMRDHLLFAQKAQAEEAKANADNKETAAKDSRIKIKKNSRNCK